MNFRVLKCVHIKLQLPTKLFQLVKRDETCVATSTRQVCFWVWVGGQRRQSCGWIQSIYISKIKSNVVIVLSRSLYTQISLVVIYKGLCTMMHENLCVQNVHWVFVKFCPTSCFIGFFKALHTFWNGPNMEVVIALTFARLYGQGRRQGIMSC